MPRPRRVSRLPARFAEVGDAVVRPPARNASARPTATTGSAGPPAKRARVGHQQPTDGGGSLHGGAPSGESGQQGMLQGQVGQAGISFHDNDRPTQVGIDLIGHVGSGAYAVGNNSSSSTSTSSAYNNVMSLPSNNTSTTTSNMGNVGNIAPGLNSVMPNMPNVSSSLSSEDNLVSNGMTVANFCGQPSSPAMIPNPSFRRNSNGLGLSVPMSVKQKIWNGESVDFSQLLTDNSIQLLANSQQQQSELTLAVEGERIVFKQPSLKKKIDSWDKWLSAFHVFMSLYLERHSARAAELLKYAETIRLASVQFSGFGWRTYDEQFRLRHAVNPASSWGDMDIELWVTVAAAASIGSATPRPKNRYNTFGPAAGGRGNLPGPRSLGSGGVCYAFNRAQGCRFAPCKFVHKCSVCSRANHNALNCRVRFGSQPAASAGNGSRNGKRIDSMRAPVAQAGQRSVRSPAVMGTGAAAPAAAGKLNNNFRASYSN